MPSRVAGSRLAYGSNHRRLLLVASLLFPVMLAAQGDRRAEQRGRESRVTLGWSGNAPTEFNPQRCGSKVAMSFGLGFGRELLPHVWLGGRGDLNYANPFKRENCLFGIAEAPLPPGPYTTTREEVTRSVPQYQFFSVAAQAAVEPLSLSFLRGRLYGGIGAVAFKPLFPRFYGVELLPGRQSRFAISVERWDATLKYDSVTYDYLNGVLRTRTANAFSKNRNSLVIRVSMVQEIGGRRQP